MKILVVGSGGREHAMVWKLAQSPRTPTLYCAPGNAGIESLATCVPIKADDIAELETFVQSEKIDLTVVGPEAPLALGQQSLLQRDHEQREDSHGEGTKFRPSCFGFGLS